MSATELVNGKYADFLPLDSQQLLCCSYIHVVDSFKIACSMDLSLKVNLKVFPLGKLLNIYLDALW